MAENQELTPEQIREKQREHARKTLEERVFQDIVGSGEVMNNQSVYGTLAVDGARNSYDTAITSDKTQEIRREVQKRKNEEAKKLGTYSRPSVSDYDVEAEIISQVEENKPLLSLGELEGIVKGIAGDFGYDFKLPEALKDYVYADLNKKILEKAQEKGVREIGLELIREALNEQERDAFMVYREILSPAYTRGAAARAARTNYFADINEVGKQITEKYKPKSNDTRH